LSINEIDSGCTVSNRFRLILAPVNWGLFRLLGHVEWAWIAALSDGAEGVHQVEVHFPNGLTTNFGKTL